MLVWLCAVRTSFLVSMSLHRNGHNLRSHFLLHSLSHAPSQLLSYLTSHAILHSLSHSTSLSLSFSLPHSTSLSLTLSHTHSLSHSLSHPRYQGEADATGGYPRGNHFSSINYACTFPAMIQSWRHHWHALSGGQNPLFPFGFVQLSTWHAGHNATCGDGLTREDSASCDVGVVRWGQTANNGSVPNDGACVCLCVLVLTLINSGF